MQVKELKIKCKKPVESVEGFSESSVGLDDLRQSLELVQSKYFEKPRHWEHKKAPLVLKISMKGVL